MPLPLSIRGEGMDCKYAACAAANRREALAGDTRDLSVFPVRGVPLPERFR